MTAFIENSVISRTKIIILKSFALVENSNLYVMKETPEYSSSMSGRTLSVIFIIITHYSLLNATELTEITGFVYIQYSTNIMLR